MSIRIQPQVNDRVTVTRKGITHTGTLVAMHSNAHLYTVTLDGATRSTTVQWWQVSKLGTPRPLALPTFAPLPAPAPWWKRTLRRLFFF